MSGIYAVLLSSQDASLVVQLDQLVSRSKRRGNDGTRYAYLRDGVFTEPISGDKLLHSLRNRGAYQSRFAGLIGCSYSRPIALDAPDAGPFISKDNGIAIAYDGIISGYTGDKLVDWLAKESSELHWDELVAQLDGQFSLVMISRRASRIFYAVKAKPLYRLIDPKSRCVVITSSIDSVRGMYFEGHSASPTELRPYTSGEVSFGGVITEKKSLVRFPGEGTLVLCGGGLDSLVASYDAKSRYSAERMRLVYFDYGAKSVHRELAATAAISGGLNARYPAQSWTAVSAYQLPLLRELATSSLTEPGLSVSITPRAGRASEWLPARNTVLMSLAIALAESQGFARIVTGINQDAAAAYPDNDEEWLKRFQHLTPFALGTDRTLKLDAPLSMMSKVDIVRHGEGLKIPWKQVPSWSCYNGGSVHCGLCSSCRARRKAFALAKVEDPTEYEQ